MAGGGLANTPFNYRINIAGRYFVFIQYDPALSASQRAGTIAVEPGDSAYSPPTSQPILIEFDAGYLHNPGLYDPQSQTLEEQAFLESLSDTVREGIVQRLRAIFQATPITILMQGDPLPAGPISRVIFSPLRILAGDQTVTDAALPPLDPTRPECQERVIFGEVLPRGANLDPGNRLLDDSAMVYVGSFQGRGETCQSAAINSVNNIVLGLSQTAAHEIGHLIGLYHVPLTDIMDRSPTQAFQRELALGRGQLLIDAQTISSTGTSEISTLLLTTVVQDPDFYFRANFTAMAQ